MKIDLVLLRAELQVLAGKTEVKVKTSRQLPVALATRFTDGKMEFKLNPRRIRGKQQLQSILAECREDAAGGY